ncbi:MAG: trypsin-like peptidase domain-containing protein [Chloroflexi bacterium]|nr:trypsin-like peptidase domain-containing protein [Chloroflexota bacterium]
MKSNMWTLNDCEWEFIGAHKNGSRCSPVDVIVEKLKKDNDKTHFHLIGCPYIGKSSVVSYALTKVNQESGTAGQIGLTCAKKWLFFYFEEPSGKDVDIVEIAKRNLVEWWCDNLGSEEYQSLCSDFAAKNWEGAFDYNNPGSPWYRFLMNAREHKLVFLFEISNQSSFNNVINLINGTKLFKEKVKDGTWRIIIETPLEVKLNPSVLQTRQISIGLLDEAEARGVANVASTLVKTKDETSPDDATKIKIAEEILRWAGYHPYLLRLVCKAFKRWPSEYHFIGIEAQLLKYDEEHNGILGDIAKRLVDQCPIGTNSELMPSGKTAEVLRIFPSSENAQKAYIQAKQKRMLVAVYDKDNNQEGNGLLIHRDGKWYVATCKHITDKIFGADASPSKDKLINIKYRWPPDEIEYIDLVAAFVYVHAEHDIAILACTDHNIFSVLHEDLLAKIPRTILTYGMPLDIRYHWETLFHHNQVKFKEGDENLIYQNANTDNGSSGAGVFCDDGLVGMHWRGPDPSMGQKPEIATPPAEKNAIAKMEGDALSAKLILKHLDKHLDKHRATETR